MTSWLRIPSKFIPIEDKAKKDAQHRVAAADALNKEGTKKSSGRFDFIKDSIGATFNTVEDIGSAAKNVITTGAEGGLRGLEVAGNQVQGGPAGLFTRGEVDPQGNYTTRRNLIGNPIANWQSHIDAQRKAGLIDEGQATGKEGLLGRLQEGAQIVNRAGKAYSADPDIAAGTKFATGVLFDPSTFASGVAKGATKIPMVGKALAESRALKPALKLAEGFDKPASALKFAAGGALGTELANRVDIPFVPKGLETWAGGVLGGGLAANNWRKPPVLDENKGALGVMEHGRVIDPEVQKIRDELQQLRESVKGDSLKSGKDKLDAISNLKEKLQALGEPDVGFPTMGELTRELENTEVGSPRHQELMDVFSNYAELQRVHTGAAMARGDIPQVTTEELANTPGVTVDSISPEQAARTSENQFGLADDNALRSDYRYLVDSVTKAEDAGQTSDKYYLDNRKKLAELEDEAKKRGLDLSQPSAKSNDPVEQNYQLVLPRKFGDGYKVLNRREETSRVFNSLDEAQAYVDRGNSVGPTSELFPSKPSQEIPKATTGLEDIPTETLQSRLASIDSAPISDLDKRLLKNSVEKELASRNTVAPEVTKPLPPEIGGGAFPEDLVDIRNTTSGLTVGERIQNRVTELKKAVLGYGVKNNEIATPIVKEATRLENIVRSQGARINRTTAEAERLFKVDGEGLLDTGESVFDLARKPMDPSYTPAQKDALLKLRNHLDEVTHLQQQFGIDLGEDVSPLLEHSKTAPEYFNRLASKVGQAFAQTRAKQEVERASTPGTMVSGDVLPKEVTDVINEHVKSAQGLNTTEASKIFNAANNSFRGMWASGDFSRFGIQDLPTYFDLITQGKVKTAAELFKAQTSTLRDSDVVSRAARRMDETNFGTDTPTTAEWAKAGLKFNNAISDDFESGAVAALSKIPGLKQTNRMFADSGDLSRMIQAQEFYKDWKSGGVFSFIGNKDLPREEAIRQIATAVNRSSGWAERAFGGSIGKAGLFAPRFLQSQIETIVKAATDGTIEGQIARRQLLKYIGAGIGLTLAVNGVRGEDTVLDPTDSNFFRIRDVKGNDISVFGPWDSLVRGVIKAGPQFDKEGDVSFGDPTFLLRSKLAPVLSAGVDFVKGTNLVGEPSNTPSALFKNLALPFSTRNIGKDNLTGIGLGLIGTKTAPLTDKEVLANRLEAAGIKTSDPDYEIKRKQFMADNPNQVPRADRGTFKRSQEITADISARRKLNEDKVVSGDQTLVDFRDNRSKLLAEQRNRKDEILGQIKSSGSTQQKKWINSYFSMFDKAQDPITKEIDSEAFDPLVAQWTSTNGPEALDFVQKYLGAGLGPVEKSYYDDLQTLDRAGYWDMPKFKGMKSGLTDKEITDNAAKVSAERLKDPASQSKSFAASAKELLTDLSPVELQDVINSQRDAFQSDELAKFKKDHRKELMWFNPRATWDTYTNTTNGNSVAPVGRALSISRGNRSSRSSTRRGGKTGSLRSGS